MDVVSVETRSRMMSSIKGKNTIPELKVRRFLHLNGFRFRIHVKNLPGCPDIVLAKYNTCIFVHGCFWHRHMGCKFATVPATRTEFWADKFRQTVLRDTRNIQKLTNSGWRVIEIWECSLRPLKPDLDWLCQAIKNFGSVPPDIR
jgi:DNA mismatch endonuclease (patch repair protein)